MKISNINFLILTFIFGANTSITQTEAVKNVKNIIGGKLDGVKTVKLYSYNVSNGDIAINFLNGKFYSLREFHQDENNNRLHNLTIKPSETGLDSSYSYSHQYEIKKGLPVIQYTYPKWPNTTECTVIKKDYTGYGQVASEETTVINVDGDTLSYKKNLYEYDNLNRLIQERVYTSKKAIELSDQNITFYYYDTLGVKCYIEENSVQSSVYKKLLSRTFLTDSIGTTNRKFYYEGRDAYYIRSEYVQFDDRKNVIRQYDYRIKNDSWSGIYFIDSTLTKNIYTTYNNSNQKTYYENKLESSYINYTYDNKNQLIERSGKNIFVEQKEFFKYDLNGNIIEYIEHWNDNVSKTTFEDYNKLGIAETIKLYNDIGKISHITKREFIYW
ncbi:MAG: hypothetical protein GQ574_18055 [Crocinitomix sp.]|nr:hypothetical protein [Crocinitomix sp.]